MQSALNDISEACRRWPLWTYLAWNGVRSRYHRSTLEPWWITLSMAIFVVVLGEIYGRLLHQNVLSYLPFLFCGLVFWTFIATTLTESSDIFFNMRSYILQIKLPYLIYPIKNIYKNIILLAHINRYKSRIPFWLV